jgi:hypothetical protein
MTTSTSQVQSKGQEVLAHGLELDSKEQLYRSLASQIAKDMLPVEDVVKAHGMTMHEFGLLRQTPWFNAVLINEMTAWQAAESTPERIKLKFQAMVEQSAPEFFKELINPKANLGDRVKLLKEVMRGGGIGDTVDATVAGGGQRVSITINMGDDVRTFDKSVTPRVIDSSVNRTQIEFEDVPSPAIEDDEPELDEDDEDMVNRMLEAN